MRVRNAATDIAHRSEARFDRRPRVGYTLVCHFGDVQIEFLQAALIIVTRIIEREMRMSVHETGRQGRIAQIDHLRIRRNLHVATDIGDLVALHEHDCVAHERFRFAIEKARCFKRDDVIRAIRSQRNCRDGERLTRRALAKDEEDSSSAYKNSRHQSKRSFTFASREQFSATQRKYSGEPSSMRNEIISGVSYGCSDFNFSWNAGKRAAVVLKNTSTSLAVSTSPFQR